MHGGEKRRCSSVVIIYIEYVTVSAAFSTSKYCPSKTTHCMGFMLQCRVLFCSHYICKFRPTFKPFIQLPLDFLALALAISIFQQSPIQLCVPYVLKSACPFLDSILLSSHLSSLQSFSSSSLPSSVLTLLYQWCDH